MAQARSSRALDGRHARLPSALIAIQKLAATRPSMVHRVRGMMPLFICTALSDSPWSPNSSAELAPSGAGV